MRGAQNLALATKRSPGNVVPTFVRRVLRQGDLMVVGLVAVDLRRRRDRRRVNDTQR